jgi:hypothetical protein
LTSKRRKSSSSGDIDFDDILKEMGFEGFRDIFNAIFEGREVSDAAFMKILDDDHKARFQKELDNNAAKKKDTRETKNEQFQGVSDHDLSTPKK